MLETLDFTFYIGSTPTFLYFDLYLNTATLKTLDFTFYIGSTPTFLYFDLYLNTAFTQNIRLYFLYRQYTNLFIFRFVSEYCLRSTLCLSVYIIITGLIWFFFMIFY